MDDLHYLRMAADLANLHSTDSSTKNFAIIVKDDCIISCDANKFPDKVKESSERWQRPLKYSFIEHAERNAIFQAAKLGKSTFNSTMYCLWYACADCARAIIQSGITRVVGLEILNKNTSKQWKESLNIGLQILEEGGIITDLYPHLIDKSLLFNNIIISI